MNVIKKRFLKKGCVVLVSFFLGLFVLPTSFASELSSAVRSKDSGKLEELINAGADSTEIEYGLPLFSLAIREGNVGMVKFLADKVKIDEQVDDKGHFPFYYVCQYCNNFEDMFRRGRDRVKMSDDDRKDDEKMMEMRGSKFDKDGGSEAVDVKGNCVEIFKILIENNASIDKVYTRSDKNALEHLRNSDLKDEISSHIGEQPVVDKDEPVVEESDVSDVDEEPVVEKSDANDDKTEL